VIARGGIALALLTAVIVALLFVSAAQSVAKKLSGHGPSATESVSVWEGKAATREIQRGGWLQRAAANRQIMIALHDGKGL
jgi:hypothetical protein